MQSSSSNKRSTSTALSFLKSWNKARAASLIALLGTLATQTSCSSKDPIGQSKQAAGSPNIVMAIVHSGGGSSSTSAAFKSDFIVLFNRGATAVDVTGWSVQYGSDTGNIGSTSSSVHKLLTSTSPGLSIAPGKYFLIQMSNPSGQGGADLTQIDHAYNADGNGSIGLGASGGKVALVKNATALNCGSTATPCTTTQLADIIDLVGYGTSASFYETKAVGALSSTTTAYRKQNGCQDNDDNSQDFEIANSVGSTPKSSATAANVCAVTPSDAGTDSTTDSSTSDSSTSDASDASTTETSTADATDSSTQDATTDTSTSDGPSAETAPDTSTMDSPEDSPVVVTDSAPPTGDYVLLNEARLNPTSTDQGKEYIELIGSGTIPPNTYMISVDGDQVGTTGVVPGTINYVKDISGLQFNGSHTLMLFKAPCGTYAGLPTSTRVVEDPNLNAPALQNGSESILVVRFTGGTPSCILANQSTATKYADLPAHEVIDAVGYRDSSSNQTFGGVELSATKLFHGVSRIPGNYNAKSVSAWNAGQFTGTDSLTYVSGSGIGTQVVAKLTPGLSNDNGSPNEAVLNACASQPIAMQVGSSCGTVVIDAGTDSSTTDATAETASDSETPDVSTTDSTTDSTTEPPVDAAGDTQADTTPPTPDAKVDAKVDSAADAKKDSGSFVPTQSTPSDSGCSCTQASNGGTGSGLLSTGILAGLIALWRGRFGRKQR